MLFIWPIRTSVWPRRTPYANYFLIAITVVLFFLSYSFNRQYGYLLEGQPIAMPIRPWAANWVLIPGRWQPWQLLSYAFLHGGIKHILGNMFFLYLFGNNINDKLGHVRYLLFYLSAAVVSGLGHTLLNLSSLAPTLGASGAIAAVVGAYLVLFPQTQITVFYWIIFFIGTFEIPALYLIGLKLILFDNIISRFPGGVAYDAHLAGYAYGVGLLLFLVATRIVSGTHYDLWVMIQQWNRRRRYRDVVASGYDPFAGVRGRRRVESREVPPTQATAQERAEIERLRQRIADWIGQHNVPAAAEVYLELMRIDPGQLLSRQYLLDIANQLAGDRRPAEAVRAYEQFLANYRGTYEYPEQVELMLGILYSRYLQDRDKAILYLQRAAGRLTDPGQLRMCRDELAHLQG
ncbi:MAG: rhomboid family intramembrane serine protease [Planctomycetes bacterium]|jgi:membrane associated rhomboid family serine protease|nr:rhomboid family intramembrane serine protease [Planctomycetota bacterium]